MSKVKQTNQAPIKRPVSTSGDLFISVRELNAMLSNKALQPYRSDRFLRLNTVLYKVGLSRSVLYRMIEKGDFPPVIKVNGSTSVWSENAVNDWMDERKQEATL